MAREWKVPHSTLTREWSSRDLSLAMAHMIVREDVGPCGHPHSQTTRPENADRYSVKTDLSCAACRVHGEYLDSHNGDMPPGVIVRVVDLHDPEHDDEHTDFGPVFA